MEPQGKHGQLKWKHGQVEGIGKSRRPSQESEDSPLLLALSEASYASRGGSGPVLSVITSVLQGLLLVAPFKLACTVGSSVSLASFLALLASFRGVPLGRGSLPGHRATSCVSDCV